MYQSQNRSKQILIVDDEADTLDTYKMWLELNGFRVDAYCSPLIALSEFRKDQYDLLLLDIRMPGMTGFELYQELRRIDPSVKVCFVTSFEAYYASLKEIYPDLAACCFVQKPVSMKDLFALVIRILGDRGDDDHL